MVLENITEDDAGWYACYTHGTKTGVITGARLEIDTSMYTDIIPNNIIFITNFLFFQILKLMIKSQELK